MHITYKLLLYNIVCTLSQRNSIWRANTCDQALNLLNEEITFYIQKTQTKPMERTLRRTLASQAQHILWRTIHGLWNGAPPPTLNTSITFNKNITKYYELFHQTIHKHITHNRSINRTTQTNYKDITSHSPQLKSKRQCNKGKNNLQSPDQLNNSHLNQIVPLVLSFLMSMLETAPNTNIIPYIWTVASPHPKTK